MPKCLFDQCCGCIELRTGCLILGYLNLIGSIIGLIITVVLAVGAKVALNSLEKEGQLNKEGAGGVSALIIGVVVFAMIIMVAYFAICVTFLVGVHQGKRGHVKAYLVCMGIFLVLCIIAFFGSFAVHPINPIIVCSLPFNILLNIYYFLVIRSYYFKMNDGSHQPAIYNTA